MVGIISETLFAAQENSGLCGVHTGGVDAGYSNLTRRVTGPIRFAVIQDLSAEKAPI
jgi:hypothetical protein